MVDRAVRRLSRYVALQREHLASSPLEQAVVRVAAQLLYNRPTSLPRKLDVVAFSTAGLEVAPADPADVRHPYHRPCAGRVRLTPG